MYRAASFFSGVGAMDYAAVAGFDGRLQIAHLCEIDAYKRSILRKHAPSYWPGAIIHEDIRHVSGDTLGQLDLIYGGFPCTDISAAGRGAGLSGPQSGLWYQLGRIISQARPRAVVLENVPTIKVRGGLEVVGQLTTMGYDGVWITLPAFAFGSPLYRLRWFYVGITDCNGYAGQAGQDHGVHPPAIGTGGASQSVAVGYETQSTRQARGGRLTWVSRRSKRGRVGGRGRQSPVGGDADGAALRLGITSHRWPAGAWLPQQPGEPPRLASPSPTWRQEIAALGEIVTPQQCLPVFQALYEFFEQQKARR
jgi:DNA (cytosine-5)-methyltransferase 1